MHRVSPSLRVNKEVSVDSKEAKSYLKSQDTKQDEGEDQEEEGLSPTELSPPGPRYTHTHTHLHT